MFKVAAVDVTARYDQTPDGNIARALQRLRSDAAELYRKITALWAYAHNDTETARVDRPFSWASWQRISLQALTAWMNPAPPCSGMAPTGTSCPAPWGLIYNTKDTNDCLESKHCFDPQPQNGGDNAAWGKAMAYALLDITEFHQRKFALIHFFDKDDFWTDIFRPSRYTPGDVLSSVSTFLNGGINYAPPCGRLSGSWRPWKWIPHFYYIICTGLSLTVRPTTASLLVQHISVGDARGRFRFSTPG